MGMAQAAYSIDAVGATRVAPGDEPNGHFMVVDLATGTTPTEPSCVGARGVLLAVAADAGGSAGAVAGATALNLLRQRLIASNQEPLPARLVRALDGTNFAIWHAARTSGRDGMATSLVTVAVDGLDAWVGWVGDARAYLVRGDEALSLTDDHRASGDGDAGQGELLQAIGLRPRVAVAVRRLGLRRGDTLLLCGAGLARATSTETMRHALEAEASSERAARRLVDLAAERDSSTTMTGLVARCSGPFPASGPGERAADTLVSVSEFDPAEVASDEVSSDAPTPRYGLPAFDDDGAAR